MCLFDCYRQLCGFCVVGCCQSLDEFAHCDESAVELVGKVGVSVITEKCFGCVEVDCVFFCLIIIGGLALYAILVEFLSGQDMPLIGEKKEKEEMVKVSVSRPISEIGRAHV